MDYFLELIDKKDEICVEHQKLLEYGLIKINETSGHIKDCIDKFNAIENVDFKCLTVERSTVKRVGRGGANGNKKQYNLTPKLFKLCLMRSFKENKYAKYYLLLEECFYYYQKYQIMYYVVLLSGKDKKLDDMTETINKQSGDIKNLINQNEKIFNLAEKQGIKLDEMHDTVNEMHETVKGLEIKIDELIKLVHKFLSNQIDLIYTFKSNIKDTKVLIIYKLQKNDKYHLVLRYCGLNQISKSINDFMKKKINKDTKIIDFVIIGAIQDNIITIQSIYKSLDSIDNMNKQTLTEISDEECNNIITSVISIISKNKNTLFVENLEKNEILKEHCDTMKHLTKLDCEFNNSVNNIVKKYLNEKINDKKNLRVNRIVNELENIYKEYKS